MRPFTMKPIFRSYFHVASHLPIILASILFADVAWGQENAVSLSLRLSPDKTSVEIQLLGASQLQNEVAGFDLQKSADLKAWTSLTQGPLPQSEVGSAAVLYVDSEIDPTAFYRLVFGFRVVATASTGEALFGFSDRFAEELAAAGQPTAEEFREMFYDEGRYVAELASDPTQAEYWDEFNAPSDEVLPGGGGWSSQGRSLDFRLNDEELALFKKNGFVVSGRLGAHSFADSLYGVFTRDLPVFVSADSILHAWHRTYVAMLSELEEAFLANRFKEVLQGMRTELSALAAEMSAGVLDDSFNDVDFFLTVALSLFEGQQLEDQLGGSGQLVQETLEAIDEREVRPFAVFGRDPGNELFDFSQFEVRGHYTSSQSLSRYFQAAMWCGRVDFRVAGPEEFSSPRELGAAMILNELVRRADQLEAYQEFDRTLSAFVGTSESMGFSQLNSILAAAGIAGPLEVERFRQLEALQSDIEEGDFGVQEIVSHGFFTELDGPSLVLPRSFTVFGQKFVMDSWALSQLVFDKIFWDGEKVNRRLPSSLDAAFTVLGNTHASGLLAGRIQNPDGVPYRDGYPIQHHLTALHRVFNAIDEEGWNQNIYTGWLNSLRRLSGLEFGPDVPEVFQTRAWTDRTMTAQLASWTELRHDTVLYVKQSITPPVICEFPYSYLEPSLEFYSAVQTMAENARNQLSGLNASGTFEYINENFGVHESIPVQDLLHGYVEHLDRFASTIAALKEIAIKQRNGQALSSEEEIFLGDMLEIMTDYVGQRTYSGWYPGLFYQKATSPFGSHTSDQWDALATDVHTDFPDEISGDPGTVLLEGVGNVPLMMVAVDCGDGESRVYAGPVFSYYEFTSGPGNFDRMTDEEWKAKLKAGETPDPPEWTRDYYVPGHIEIPAWAE